MIDTHTHLYDTQFDDDRDAVITRAVEAGVHQLLLPNIDSETIQPMFDLCQRYPQYCFPMLGLHPTSVGRDFEQQLSEMSVYLERQLIAIGEIGIDLYWDKQYCSQQMEAFRIQLGWAKQYKLPVSIHCRKSYNEIIAILKAEQDGSLTGVFHCFPGNIRQAEEVIELGFALGVGGVVTYKNAAIATVVQHVDISHILTETDAPYLPPAPYRGKRNESAYIYNIVEKIAELKHMPVAEIASITQANARRIFQNLPPYIVQKRD